MKDYVSHYEAEAAVDPSVLNRKVPREVFAPLLDRIGELLLQESKRLAREPGPVYDFLEATPLPSSIKELLPRDFRVFCLALNAVKQWVSAEQNATDRFLFGGTARDLFRSAASKCIVTGEPLGSDVELHHPVRDGRPPLPLSKRGHDVIEGQLSAQTEDVVEAALLAIKREGNRSWAMLRRGCLDLLGKPVSSTSSASAANARTFARKAAKVSNLSYAQLLSWLDAKGR
ncbi:MAG TPA: hypothetical protein VKA60_25005 [Blastocatellia bacterium]|nr:hypothetical protein [Blastocatellia bacterium]